MFSIKFSVLLFITYIVCVCTNLKQSSCDSIVAFGDSHTDTGNVYNLTQFQWPLVPPYYQGRFTNGPVWIDILNSFQIMNYAYGDAAIDSANLIIGFTGPNRTVMVPSIRQQIVLYLADTILDTSDLSATIYIIWSGGNEYLINSSVSSSIVVGALLNAVYDLLAIEIQQLIVVNLPPLQLFPGTNDTQRLGALVNEHNNYLLSNITIIQSKFPKASLRVFDLYSIITDILSNNSVFQLNKMNKCWNIVNSIVISQCTDPDTYVFIDDYHFTSVIHQIIADSINQFILSSSSGNFASSKFYIYSCLSLFIIKKFST
ncbi:unnamed protein product [Rotaria socialis]|uniref:Uncharacterized protein n=1 Tax=Rotaria socialis TaxID=392032 RepID=A0A818HEI4_9BILA|nr:unnamed protein product [Rotaria socialis]CAF4791280.1 unnamed protein product [Rotaria socialis]